MLARSASFALHSFTSRDTNVSSKILRTLKKRGESSTSCRRPAARRRGKFSDRDLSQGAGVRCEGQRVARRNPPPDLRISLGFLMDLRLGQEQCPAIVARLGGFAVFASCANWLARSLANALTVQELWLLLAAMPFRQHRGRPLGLCSSSSEAAPSSVAQAQDHASPSIWFNAARVLRVRSSTAVAGCRTTLRDQSTHHQCTPNS